LLPSKRYARLFWPVFIEQAMGVMVNFLATVMLRSVSGAAMAGVGLLGIINFLLMTSFTAIASGVTAVVSQHVGAGEYKTAGATSSHSIVLTVYISAGLGLLMTALSWPILLGLFPGAEADVLEAAHVYLIYSSISLPFLAIFSAIAGIMRAAGNTRVPMLGALISNVIFTAVAAVCIYHFNMGVHGSGLGLAVSRLATAGFMAWWLYRGKGEIYLTPLRWKPDMVILRPVLKIAVPAGIDSMVFNLGKLLLNVFLSGMGTPVLEAHAIVNNLASFTILPGSTMGIVAVILVGQAWGSGGTGKAKRLTLVTLGIGSLMQLAACIPFLLLPGHGITWFNPGFEAFEAARAALLVNLIATPFFWSASFALPQTLRATGDAKFTMYVSIVSMILARVLLAWVLGVHYDLRLMGIWLAMIIDWVVRSAFFIARALRMHKRVNPWETPEKSV
jgi:putative MATE family efflux protein